MNDRVLINGLRLFTVLGVHQHERQLPRPVILDLEMAASTAAAARDDDLAQALDYEAVAAALERLLADNDFLLVETLAERCAECVVRQFDVPWLKLQVRKPAAVAHCDSVGVVIERRREDFAAG